MQLGTGSKITTARQKNYEVMSANCYIICSSWH